MPLPEAAAATTGIAAYFFGDDTFVGSMLGSESGGRGGGGGSSSAGCFDIDICPDLILAGVAVFSAAAFFALYVAITMARRRKKRSEPVSHTLQDLLLTGIK